MYNTSKYTPDGFYLPLKIFIHKFLLYWRNGWRNSRIIGEKCGKRVAQRKINSIKDV